jgi:hypothetical protein
MTVQYEAAAIVLSIVGSLVSIGAFVYKEIRTLKNNHLRHIEDGVDRVEKKLDKHIDWHLDQHGRTPSGN